MSAPTTLPALRAAVARVLVARGESAEGLYVARDQWGVSIGVTVCGCVAEWIYEPRAELRDAIADAWASVLRELLAEADTAEASVAATRRPERKSAAVERLRLARAALAAAREVGE